MEQTVQAVPGLASWRAAGVPPQRHLSLDGARPAAAGCAPPSQGWACCHGEHPRDRGVTRQPLDPQSVVSR